MSETTAVPLTLQQTWGLDLQVAVCEHCHWRYLVLRSQSLPGCPNCCGGPLGLVNEDQPDMPQVYQPELMTPYTLSEPDLIEAVRVFATGIPFPPDGLTQIKLRDRLTPLYLPMWLVDSFVSGHWQGEVGYNYEVVSHQEHYNGDMNRWQSKEVTEPRIRWENRLGQIQRAYQNIAAPALGDTVRLEKQLGQFNLDSARSYDPDCLHIAGLNPICIRLPDHTPQEAWSEAAAAFQKTAADECQKACAADHIRQFRWRAQFSRLNWTLMLLPLYATTYLDDQGKPQPVLIHGQTGKVTGVRRSSLRLAGRTSLWVLITGILLFLIGLLVDAFNTSASSNLAAISTYVLILGLIGMMAASVPFIIAWDFNHRQALEEAETKPEQ